MTTAALTVVRTAPLLTVQDAGRLGFLAHGITQSGALDPLALTVANALVGNTSRAAALEACLGGAAFRFERDTEFALTGADVDATLDGVRIERYMPHHARASSTLAVERVLRGTAWYLAVRGGIDTPLVLGSRATLLSAGIGARITAGHAFAIAHDTARTPRPQVPVPAALRARFDGDAIPLCPGPRADALTESQWADLVRASFTVSRAMSRVGYRLDGPAFLSGLPADLASEPACAGAMQLPPDGHPIVLMADHPTVGGYPMIGVVPTCALGRFAQQPPGATVRFVRTSIADAVHALANERGTLSKFMSPE